ncbi:MAG: response regulator [Thermodesulfobacteriota bacterium]|nr:response regulator [Thermodesulfobacteriota bacterium]
MAVRILTVDDSRTIRTIVKKAFRPFDCEILEGQNGVEGLALAAKEKPDLIILDITMPMMDGVEMLSKLRNEPELKETPVIMLTAEAAKDRVIEVVKIGVKDYIIKPFEAALLIEKVQKIMTLPEKSEEESDAIKECFSRQDGVQLLALPEKATNAMMAEVENGLMGRIKEMEKAGIRKLLVDLSKFADVDLSLVRFIVSVVKKCKGAKVAMRIVSNEALTVKLKTFQEVSGLAIDHSVDEAKTALGS